ncbi:signal peptide peptidase SppA [Caldalkalibacillus mannanilyticus]|uniref:signal peptide peptidase SppA n=1 Tax=Caldalkalibacillus mannanilyticus TaxID=1418 RepID=UPI0004685E43|nr:signal peptide peptidase SppA [Caldalkalibacillus mannanilyticus]
MNTKRWIAIVIFVVLLIASSVSNVQQTSRLGGLSMDQELRTTVYKKGGFDQIALLEVEGIIMDLTTNNVFSSVGYDHRLFLKQLQHAFEDESIKGIVLRVNSPGGGVVESDEIFHTITKLKKEHDKPIVAYMANTAASGGYYISAPADHIMANRSTITGSIGVIMQNFNIKELADEWGIKAQTFKSGPHKDIMSPFKNMTEEEAQILQTLTDEMYQNFVQVIVDGRGMDKTKVLELADGRIYSGQQAQELGLVDSIGFLENAFEKTAELAQIEDPTVVEYKKAGLSFFGPLYQSLAKGPSDFLSLRELLYQQETPSMMYLYTW